MTLKDKTLFITGASRGIGKAIAVRAAREGANVAIAAKTVVRHPKLPGTIHSAAEEVEAAGGRALALQVDIREEEQVLEAVEKTVQFFGGLDILVNNASALFLKGTLETPLKRFDLMNQVCVRGAWLCSKACLPYLLKAPNPHILSLAPPLNLQPGFFGPHLAYSLAKYGMSLCVLGLAEEFREKGVAVNALWPKTTVATAAVENLLGGQEAVRRSRKPEIVADAAAAILRRPSRSCTGNFYLDEEVLREEGVADLSPYSVDPTAALIPDLFV